MIALWELVPGMALFLLGLGLVGAAFGLFAEYAWDSWQEARRWREVDHLARVERAFGRRPAPRRLRRGRRWERAWNGPVTFTQEPLPGSLARPRS